MPKSPLSHPPVPVLLFLLVLASIVAATVYHSPGWGLMDDFQNLDIARKLWASDQPLAEFARLVRGDLHGWGMLRPVYHLWIATVYHFLAANPTLAYILVALLNFLCMAALGFFASQVFQLSGEKKAAAVFAYPLLFFLFTPFWNLFMYISVQEKFVLWFGTLALLAMARFYRTGRPLNALAAGLMTLLALLGKPTAIFLVLACALFALADLALIGSRRRASALVFAVCTSLLAGYFLFVLRTLGRYTGAYGQKLSPSALLAQLGASPGAVKAAVAVALLALPFYLFMARRKAPGCEPFALVLPLGVLSYILVVLPWGFPNYILSPLAPFLLLTLFPLYRLLASTSGALRRVVHAAAAAAVAAALLAVVLPRIQRQGDIRLVLERIRALKSDRALFFVPPPFHETAQALAGFSGARLVFLGPLPVYAGGSDRVVRLPGAEVAYAGDPVLSSARCATGAPSYLVCHPDFAAVRLDGVQVGEEAYGNRSWKIFRLDCAAANRGKFRARFGQTLAERLLAKLKRL